MSRVPMGSSTAGASPLDQDYLDRYDGVAPNQGVGAELIAEHWGLSRTQLDEFALRSHERAAAAQDEGRFDAQLARSTPPTAGSPPTRACAAGAPSRPSPG